MLSYWLGKVRSYRLQAGITLLHETARLLHYSSAHCGPCGAGSRWGAWWSGGREHIREPVERMFVRYRMLRKVALANAIQSLRDALLVSGEL